MVSDYVKKVKFVKGLTIEQVAKAINYSRTHLSAEMKKDNPTIEGLLIAKFPDVFQDIKPTNVHDSDAFAATLRALILIVAEHEAELKKKSYTDAVLRIEGVIADACKHPAGG